MDFMTPPIFDILDFQTWKVKMFLYLKALGIHVYLATIGYSYFLNGKHLEANTKAIHTLKSTLNDEYLSKITNLDSTFVIWNTICSLEEQTPHEKESGWMIEAMLATHATWSKGMTPLR